MKALNTRCGEIFIRDLELRKLLTFFLAIVLVGFVLSTTNPALAVETESKTVEFTYTMAKLEYPSSAYAGDTISVTITGWSKEEQGTLVTKVSVKFVGFTTDGEYASHEESWSSEQGFLVPPTPRSETFELNIPEDIAAGYTVTQIEVTYADPQRGTEASDWFPTIFIESPYHKLYDDATEEIQSLKSQLAEAQKGSGELKTELEDLKSENLALQDELSQVKKQNDDLKTENSELQKKLDAANTQIEDLKSELTKAQADYDKLQSKNEELQKDLETAQKDLISAQGELTTVRNLMFTFIGTTIIAAIIAGVLGLKRKKA